jgi:hypothetical protein
MPSAPRRSVAPLWRDWVQESFDSADTLNCAPSLIDSPAGSSKSGVNGDISAIDQGCAAALRGEVAAWPEGNPISKELATIKRQLHFHGIAGLLHERRGLLVGWPQELLALLHKDGCAV